MLETAILNILKADSGIVAIVGERIRPLALAKDDIRPYVTYQVTSRNSYHTLSDGPLDNRMAEFELGIMADDYFTVIDLSDKVRDRFDDYSVTISGVQMDVYFDGESDVEEAVPDGADLPIYVRIMTFRTLYKLTA